MSVIIEWKTKYELYELSYEIKGSLNLQWKILPHITGKESEDTSSFRKFYKFKRLYGYSNIFFFLWLKPLYTWRSNIYLPSLYNDLLKLNVRLFIAVLLNFEWKVCRQHQHNSKYIPQSPNYNCYISKLKNYNIRINISV